MQGFLKGSRVRQCKKQNEKRGLSLVKVSAIPHHTPSRCGQKVVFNCLPKVRTF